MNKKLMTALLLALTVIFCTAGATSVDAAAKIKLSTKKITITKGKTKTIKLKNAKKSKVKWSSTNKKVAKVNSKGKISAVKPGTAYIKAKYKGKTYKCKVIVKAKKSKASKGNSSDGSSSSENSEDSNNSGSSGVVYLSATGSKYHSVDNCGNMNPAKARSVTEAEAISLGYGRCSKCW